MSHLFKVGDRVRIISALRPKFLGCQATVVGVEDCHHVLRGWGTYCILNVDGFGEISTDGFRIGLPADCLVPTQPPKSQIDEILAMRDLPDFEIARICA